MTTSSRPLRRRLAVGSCAVAGAVLLASCSTTVSGTGALGAGTKAGSGPRGTSEVGLSAYVSSAAKKTAAQSSADLAMTMNMQVQGQSITMNGTGAIDFVHKAMSMSMSMGLGGMSMTMHELLAGGAMYMSMNAAGQTMKAIFGKDWIRVPLGASANSAFTQDPVQMLDQLEQTSGVTVTSLGPSSIDGTAVNGYAVTMTTAAAIAGARQRLAQLGLPARLLQQAEQALAASGPVHTSVYVDPAQNVLRRVTMHMSMNLGAAIPQAGSVQASVTTDFTHYGTPVHIVLPPSSDVANVSSLGNLFPH